MQSLSQVQARAAALVLPAHCVIDGQLVGAADGAVFDNVTPRDGSILSRVPSCGAADVDRAVGAARAAFGDRCWRALAPAARKKALLGLAELMERDREDLALMEALDTGKPISDALTVDVPLAIGTTRWYGEALDKIYGEVGPNHSGKLSYAVHEPLGVIGAITPWNFPLHMAMWKVAPALAMGNSVVLKPAEQSPLTAMRVAELALEAGIPPGVFNVVTGFGETAGQALSRHMDVDMIAFTGSGAVGRRLMIASGESNLKRVSLELGGKSPQIVFADCPDLDAAAQAAVWGIFYNQGEVCTAASRLLVQKEIKESFLARVIEIARAIEVGDPLDPATRFGAMVSKEQLDTATRYIAKGLAEGGELVLGGARARAESGGFYLEPTIFDNLTPTSTLAREEVFGPVLGVLTFDDADEAIRIANDTVFGLAAGLWTANIDVAMKVSRALHAGLVWVNGWDACDITMPFGGFKQSGFGRDRSLHALHKYADLKSVTFTIRDA
ncbi:aldehyde dehydrogenase [Sphingomonas sp. MMSM20]|uniref:aldehyde dehydrogenase n=1 Tax=Sphingomonas lycopersici TaxID=2951807 RepID=UPI0022377888|nr:aldehyde dehydrogenase [Sphingomonas lycopersici]MCW6528704.1 aldehyde dehydrogenase [Sphingomonas lycopersici]